MGQNLFQSVKGREWTSLVSEYTELLKVPSEKIELKYAYLTKIKGSLNMSREGDFREQQVEVGFWTADRRQHDLQHLT